MAGRPLWWVAGLSLALVTAVGLVAWVLIDNSTYVAPTPSDSVPTAQPMTTVNRSRPMAQSRAAQAMVTTLKTAGASAGVL